MIKPNFLKTIVIGLMLATLMATSGQQAFSKTTLKLADLRCENLENPTGIDAAQPGLSWILNSTGRGRNQAAYQILVASSRENLADDNGDLWNSGRVNSSQSVQVSYAGKPLASGALCFWKVRVWDDQGTVSEWSQPAFWTMGLLQPEDWRTKWVGLDGEVVTNESRRLPARWLRKEFAAPKEIKRATVCFSGLGWSELYINGEKIGDHVLSPPLSEYPKRVYYETFEVAGRLKPGANAVGVVLGNGRFYAPRRTHPTKTLSFDFPKLLLQLHIEYADGTATNIVSDESWKLTTNGPIVANNEYDGEEYDARKEFPGWSEPGFDDSQWQPVQIVSSPDGVPSGIRQEPIRVTQRLKPVSVKELNPGVFIFDMGQNMVGWCQLKVRGPAATRVELRHAETLKPDGSLYTANLRSARATDIYTLKGHGEEVWQPRFTLHGFRFVEMTGYPGRPTLDSLTGCVVNDDLPVTGEFECSNPLLNQIYHNIVWGVRGNYHSIPTDCPQRDERQGWLGDRAEESRGETYFFDNEALYAKWLQDMADAQKTNGSIPDVCPSYWPLYNDDVTWPSTSIVIPEMLRDQFADEQAVARHYDSARMWIEHMMGFVTNGIIARDRYGDWCVPPEDPTLIHSKDPKRNTNPALLATPFFYHDLRLMENEARRLGKTDDANCFGKLADEIKVAFNEKFLNRDLGQYDNGTPTSCVLPLAFGLVPDDMRGKIFDHLVRKITDETHGHIGTGLVGGQFLMRVLTANGRLDLAYMIATQKTYPSWGYMVEHGATTIWELWNGDTANPAMNSGNHVMLVGDLAIWLYEDLAGIKADPEQPGFKHIIMQPTPVGDLKFVRATHLSPYGWISSEWHWEGDQFDWQIKIPANTTATVYLPAQNVEAVTESGQPLAGADGVKFLRVEGGRVVVDVQSGAYHFVCKDTK
jgi:alpha-L-rhamnosidase